MIKPIDTMSISTVNIMKGMAAVRSRQATRSRVSSSSRAGVRRMYAQNAT